jgi:hypothetical protein
MLLPAQENNLSQTDTLYFEDTAEEEIPFNSIMPDISGKKGLLFIANTDSVEILLDSIILGFTPFVLDTLQDGVYSFLARKKGFYQKRITSNYSSDTLSTINIELREPSSISFITEPNSASILINRKKVGVSPFTAHNLKPEEYNFMILKDGYELFDTTINLQSGQKDTLYTNLVPESTTSQKSAISQNPKTKGSNLAKSKSEKEDIVETEETEKKKKKIDKIGIIVFLSVMVLLMGMQEYNRQ